MAVQATRFRVMALQARRLRVIVVQAKRYRELAVYATRFRIMDWVVRTRRFRVILIAVLKITDIRLSEDKVRLVRPILVWCW